MLPRLLACAFVLLSPVLCAQTADAPPSLASRISDVLKHESNGHSPTPEEIASFDPIDPLPNGSALGEALPLLLKALENSDAAVRTLALTALGGLQTVAAAPPEAVPVAADASAAAAPATHPAPSVIPAPASYKPEVAAVLAPAIVKIAAHLTEDSQANRLQTAIVLGGFTPDPPAALYAPLLAYLKRDDAIGTVGEAVVSDLLQVGPIEASTAEAASRYLRRSDQTPASRADLVDAIASKPNQSRALNKTLLTYLSSDDPSLRARLILSLPQLDLAPEVFADTKSLVEALANNSQENLQVVNAAKSIVTCWTAVKMATGCPVY